MPAIGKLTKNSTKPSPVKNTIFTEVLTNGMDYFLNEDDLFADEAGVEGFYIF